MMFPLNPPRSLHLTSPLLKGADVRDLQKAINLWSQGGRSTPAVTIDSVYGPATAHAAGAVAWSEGLLKTDMSKNTIRLIWHPWLRNPGQRRRAADRARAPHGLSALPVIAQKYIGISERPPGSNRGNPFPSGWERNFGMDGVSWCGCFAGSVVNAGGGHVTSRVAFCPFIRLDAMAGASGFERWVTDHHSAGPGWLVLYDWNGDGTADHVGVVESLEATGVRAIEGNTSGSNPSDGGMVARMLREYGSVLGYAKPRL